MAQVNFYILPDDNREQRLLFACRLAEKVYKLGHRIYLHNSDEQQAQQLDELLWSFQPASFVPHALGGQASETAVHIGWQAIDYTAHENTVLINLDVRVPAFFHRFARISEIVVQAPDILHATRNAWRFYQEQGYTLERHDLRPRAQ